MSITTYLQAVDELDSEFSARRRPPIVPDNGTNSSSADDAEWLRCESDYAARQTNLENELLCSNLPGFDILRPETITTRPQLWAHIRMLLNYVETFERLIPTPEQLSERDLMGVYEALHRLNVPWAFAPPYPQFSRLEAIHQLRHIANRLQNDETSQTGNNVVRVVDANCTALNSATLPDGSFHRGGAHTSDNLSDSIRPPRSRQRQVVADVSSFTPLADGGPFYLDRIPIHTSDPSRPFEELAGILHELFWRACTARTHGEESSIEQLNSAQKPWAAAEELARRTCVARGIPFLVFDSALATARETRDELFQISLGNRTYAFDSMEGRYLEIERRLRELGLTWETAASSMNLERDGANCDRGRGNGNAPVPNIVTFEHLPDIEAAISKLLDALKSNDAALVQARTNLLRALGNPNWVSFPIDDSVPIPVAKLLRQQLEFVLQDEARFLAAVTVSRDGFRIMWRETRDTIRVAMGEAQGAFGNLQAADPDNGKVPVPKKTHSNNAAAIEQLLGKEGRKVLEIVHSERSTDEKMREICRIDNQFVFYKSPQWAELLGVTDAAIRQTHFWKVERKQAMQALRK